MNAQDKNNLIIAFQSPREGALWGSDALAKQAVVEVVALIQAGKITTLEDANVWYARLSNSVFA